MEYFFFVKVENQRVSSGLSPPSRPFSRALSKFCGLNPMHNFGDLF